MTDALDAAGALVRRGGSGALVVALDGPDRWRRSLVDERGGPLAGSISEALLEAASPHIGAMVAAEESGVIDVEGGRLYVETLTPPPRLLLFGAGPIGEALCSMAARAGFTVEVADPRSSFAVPERFPDAASVRCAWPEDALAAAVLGERTYVVSLLHEARFESELFPAVLGSPVRYVGALGSARTHAARVARLRDRGFDAAVVARIHGPVGLRIGAVTPEEIAVAILAEMIQARRGVRGST